MTNKIFISLVSGFLAGVFVSSFLTLSPAYAIFFAVIAIALILLSYFKILPKTAALLAAIALVFFSIGILRFYLKDSSAPRHQLDNFVERSVEIEGVIKEEVEHRENTQRFLVEADKISLFQKDYSIEQNILVSSELYPEFSYGDRVRVSGKLASPENFITDTGREFDYINYLRKDNIFYTMSFAHAAVLAVGEGNKIKQGILSLKEKFLGAIGNAIPAPESSLLSGLLLGVKSSLGEKLQDAFINTGLVHIIVLSGYNVTIIAEAIIKTLSFLSMTAGIYIGGISIILFAIMTGAGATIIRASIMAILALAARATGRNYEITRALFIAAIIMVFQNPYILVFDISFELSFLATLGLIYMSPIMNRFFRFLPERFAIREISAASVGVQIFVLPFILYKMGNLSLVSPITNILVLPFIPATMFYGFVAGLFGLFSHVLALPFGFIAYALLKFEIMVVEIFSNIPVSHISVSKFPFIMVLICYALIFWWIKSFRARHKEEV